jgi:hypothetical protein
VYIPTMLVDLQKIRDRTVNAIALVGVTFLNKLWDELEHRPDVCRTARGSHIERTWCVNRRSVTNCVVIFLFVSPKMFKI